MRRQRVLVGAAVVAVPVSAAVALLLLLQNGTRLTTAVDDVTETIVPLLAAGACYLASRAATGRARIAWRIFGLSPLLWGLGQAAWTWQEVVQNQAPSDLFPSWPDLGYLAAVPVGIIGLVAFPALRRGRAERARAFLDGLLTASSAVFVSWALVLGALYAAETTGVSDFDGLKAMVISLAYPIADLVMITIVLAALTRRRHGSRTPLMLIALGVVANAVADSVFNYLTTIQNFGTGNVADVGWVIGNALIGLGALYAWAHPDGGSEERGARAWSRSAALVPYIPVAIAGCVAVVMQLRGQASDRFLFWDGLLIVGCVLLRQLVILLDNTSLNQSLETKVADRTHDLELRTGELIVERGKVARREERLRSLLAHSSDVVAIIDEAHAITWASESSEGILGFAPRFLSNLPISDLVHPDDRKRFEQTLGALSAARQTGALDLRFMTRNSEWRDVEVRLTNLVREPAVAGIVLNIRDVSERRALERQLLHQTFHDSLTKLPNRALFLDRLDHEIRRQKGRSSEGIGVMYLDLDGFKAINDSLGHEVGDRLLLVVADRLQSTVRPGDTVARLGGDEFGVILEDIATVDDAVEAATRVLDAMRGAFNLGDRDLYIGASIGVALPIDGTEHAQELLQYADLAMYQAKERGRNAVAVFQPSMQSVAVQRLEMESALRAALSNDEFRVFYQPIVDLGSRAVVGMEALIRWFRSDGTMISPLDFIPLAEQSGLIVPIGRWVLRQACADLKRFQETLDGYGRLTVSVNLSPRQLRDDAIVDDVRAAIADSGLDPHFLILEVTESMLVSGTDGSTSRLAAFRDMGIRIALDDFGTGYSSLSYLRQMPLDVIKIDRSFVLGINDDQTTSAVARSIVSLAESLSLGVIAEGIETDLQRDELMRIGCVRGQGFHFARPIPPEQITTALIAMRPVTVPKV